MSKALATKNVAAILLSVALVLGFTFAVVKPAKADMISDLQAQVSALMAQIAALSGSSSTNSGTGCYTFTQTLTIGSTGGEVMWVQKFLNGHGFKVAVTGAGSPGNETSTFGPLTRAAVAAWQAASGVSPTAGYWGPISRAKANSICAGTTPNPTPTPTPTPTGSLMISAAAQPANSLAPKGASRVPFTTFTLTNSSGAAVTVNGVTVQRTGLAQDAAFAGIVLVDSNGVQLGTSRTFDTNHQATVGDTFTIQPGSSMTLTVAGNMASDETSYAGQVAALSVIGVNTSATVSGSLPISGAQQTINNTLTVGTATLYVSSLDPQSAQSKNIGDTGVKVSGIRVTAGSAEDVKLFSVRWRLNGSVGSGDITNVKTYVDGVAYDATVSADGRYYTTIFPGGILLAKGISKDVYAQVDITGSNASGRTLELDIDRASDIYIVGQTYGYGITPTAASAGSVSSSATHVSSFTTGQPFFQGVIITVTGSSVTTIGRATEVPAGNIAVNVPGQVIGGFVADMKGEAITVNTMVFHVATSTGAGTGLLTNVTLVNDKGAVLAGPVDATYQDATTQKITFSNAVTIPTGRHIYTIKGTVPTTAVNGETFIVSTAPATDWTGVTGQTTGNNVTLTTTTFSMNTATVRAASLNITAGAVPPAQTVVAGAQGLRFATIQLDAQQSGEDIRLSSIPVRLIENDLTSDNNLSTCQLVNNSGVGTPTGVLNTGSNVVNTISGGLSGNTTNTFTFDNSLTVPKGQKVTLDLNCNLLTSATSSMTFQFGIGASSAVTYSATGVQSGTALTNDSNLTAASSNSGTQTVAGSSLAASTDSSSPSYALVAGGTSGQTVGAIKLRATGEDMLLTELGLTGSAAAYSDVTQVTIWDGANQVGSLSFSGTATVATSTLTTPVTLTKNVDKVLTLKVSVADVGTGQVGTAGDLVTVDISAGGAKATGVSSGGTTYSTGVSAVAGVRLLKSYPTVATVALPSSAISAGRLMRFSVSANSKGPIGLEQVSFTISTSTGITVAGVNLYAYTDSSFSTPVSSAVSGLFNSSSVTATSTSVLKLFAGNVTGGAIQIPAGSTYYFELRGSLGGAVAGSSITTTLLGDTAYGTLATATSTQNNAYNFVWSPNSTTTSSYNSNDWTSGYGVPGLPASSLSQTVTQ